MNNSNTQNTLIGKYYSSLYKNVKKNDQQSASKKEDAFNELSKFYPKAKIEKISEDAKEWAKNVAKLCSEAKLLAQSGKGKDSIEFDLLKRKCHKLNYNAFGIVSSEFNKYSQCNISTTSKEKCKLSPVKKVFSTSEKNNPPFSNTKKPKSNYISKVFYNQSSNNEIFRLKPAKSWTLLIDETGTDFNTNGKGMIGGVIFDDSNKLPPQGKHHATSEIHDGSVEIGDEILNTILVHNNCGVFVMPVQNYSSAHGWINMLATYINLVIDMLPLGEDDTTISIRIEKKDNDDKFNILLDFCRTRLQVYTPERAKQVRIKGIKDLPKEDPLNPYPDIVAHTCMADSDRAQERLKRVGWKNSGVMPIINPNTYQRMLENYYMSTVNESPENWSEIVVATDGKNSLVEIISNAIGKEAHETPERWHKYLGYVLEHLDSKAINMHMLKQQINWLKKFEPDLKILSGRARLLWLMAQLAEENHNGFTVAKNTALKEYRKLSLELFEEDAPLCCFADLHLAVTYTNSYQFDRAGEIVARWENICPATIGLKMYGRLLSTLGQHKAFVGKNVEAINYFKKAIASFSKLSDTSEAYYDIKQTYSYLIIAMIDGNIKGLESQLCKYLEMESLADAINNFAISTEASEKYMHHILLRYLVTLPKNNPLCKQYLSLYEQWGHSKDGHPWELIELYRGILLYKEGVSSYKESLDLAHKIASEGGPTLKIIDSVIMAVMAVYSNGDFDEYDRIVYEVIKELPDIGDNRVRLMSDQSYIQSHTMDFIKEILPFNFR